MDSSSRFWPYLDCWRHMDSLASDKPFTAAIQVGTASAACACREPCHSREAALMAVDGCAQVAGAPSSMLRWFADSSDDVRPFAAIRWAGSSLTGTLSSFIVSRQSMVSWCNGYHSSCLLAAKWSNISEFWVDALSFDKLMMSPDSCRC